MPSYVSGQLLMNLKEEHLSCNPRSTTLFTTSSPATESTTPQRQKPSTSSEPEIIWTVAPTTMNGKMKHKDDDLYMGNSTDDTLIIGIFGGVVAFIAIVVMVVCICRLRWAGRDAQMAAIASSIREPSMSYSGKMNQEMYMSTPYNGTMTLQSSGNGQTGGAPMPMVMSFMQPVQMMHPASIPPSNSPQPIYGYYDTPPLPVYVPCPSENKFER